MHLGGQHCPFRRSGYGMGPELSNCQHCHSTSCADTFAIPIIHFAESHSLPIIGRHTSHLLTSTERFPQVLDIRRGVAILLGDNRTRGTKIVVRRCRTRVMEVCSSLPLIIAEIQVLIVITMCAIIDVWCPPTMIFTSL